MPAGRSGRRQIPPQPLCYDFFMAEKKKKTRGQMAEARRMSGLAGQILSYETYMNPGVGAVFPRTGRDLSVSDDLARFGAPPSMGGYSAEEYEKQGRPRRVKPNQRPRRIKKKD